MPRVVRTQVEFEGRVREHITVVEEEALQPWTEQADLSIVGQPMPRVDGRDKVTGKALYTYDVDLPGMLVARILRSPHPHARLKRLDVSEAQKLTGVWSVITHVNAPRIPWFNDSYLFDTVLRYQGEEVAAVAADNAHVANTALSLIQAEYEELPFVVNLAQALRPDAPAVRAGGNVITDAQGSTYRRGDPDGALGTADVVVEGVFETQRASHTPLEPHGSVAWWQEDLLTVWDSTQSVFGVRDDIAEALHLPLSKVRVISCYFGGGFGAKQSAGKQAVIAALLSKQTGRPVKLMLDRTSEFLAGGCRSATRQTLRIGASKDGSLAAIALEAYADIGAYGAGPMEVGGPARELYRCPNVATATYAVYTNTGPTAAFRAPGYAEGAFALESMMDRLAHQLGMDPLDLRLKNDADVDPRTSAPYSAKGLDRAYRRGADLIGWQRRNEPATKENTSRRRGIGMASQIWGGGGGPPAYAIMKLNRDGTAQLVTGTQDIGTGTRVALCQIAAEELGFRLEDVSIALGDTQSGPYAPVSAGSMTLASMGPAVRAAAKDTREQLVRIAGDLLSLAVDDLVFRDSQIHFRDVRRSPMPIRQVLGQLGNFTIIGRGARGPNPSGVRIRTFGAQFAEVEVDLATGAVELIQLVAVHDCGRVVNQLTTRSQVIGGATQGIGYALTEEQVHDKRYGLFLNANLEGYKIPTAMDVPDVRAEFSDLPDTVANSIGAKGIGEPPIIPTAPAIANAIYNAIGWSPSRLPVTHAEILARGEQS